MKASAMQREDVARFVESEEGKGFMDEADRQWGEVMRLARENGFIVQAYGGTATLATYGAMMEQVGTEGVVRMLQMSGIDIPPAVEKDKRDDLAEMNRPF